MADFQRFEVETCECGHTVPLGFIHYDKNSCGTCMNCIADELIFRLDKKNKQIKRMKSRLLKFNKQKDANSNR